MSRSLATACVVILLSAFACGDSTEAREARKKVNEAIDATKTLVVKTWEDLREKAQPQLDKANEQLEKLQAEIEKHGAAAQEKTKQLVEDVKSRLGEASKKLEEAKSEAADAAADSWKYIQEKLEAADRAMQKAREELQK